MAITHLKIGDKALDFTAVNQNGEVVKLSDFKGSKLVLFFYPKASTPGCTLEANNLRDNYQSFINLGYKVIGVSADSIQKQLNFCQKNNLPFPLLADENKQIIIDYGVWGEKKFMGRTFDGIHRTTFILSENGIIEKIIDKVDTKNHTFQIINT